ncbi:MAG TPA: helix-turn-helix domain-containing protein [Pirellulales bacterium]|nr:helix-turn-helix domain-containing protein [Pirellulales bacterium]
MTTKQRQTTRSKREPAAAGRSKKGTPASLAAGSLAKTVSVVTLRKEFGLNRKMFARLTGYSERAIAQWESGTALGGASVQKMNEMLRLHRALAEVMKADFVPQWLQQPNDAFGGLKPIEVVERGEIDRIWRMIYLLESGTPG